MENDYIHFVAFTTELGITIYAFTDTPNYHYYECHDTPEKALDHLKAKLLMKASKLRLEAANLLMAVADFTELEKINPTGE